MRIPRKIKPIGKWTISGWNLPKKVDISILAYDALKIMQSNNISQLIVISDDEYKGIVHIHEIIKEGLV